MSQGINQTRSPTHLSSQSQDLSKLDDLVAEYIYFRGYKRALTQFNIDRQGRFNTHAQDGIVSEQLALRSCRDRVMSALESGDYPQALTLWDALVIQTLNNRSVAMNNEARTAEFILNLFLAIYPFRSEVIKSAGTPRIASATAARSMTIFKHFLESRGHRLTQRDQEFANYRNLHKIAFPPTHPQFKHLFTEDWTKMAKYRLAAFLERFFGAPEPPLLCQIFQNHDGRADAEEIKLSFQKREKKLIRFSKSLYDITNELVVVIENGNTVDKEFLSDFRIKFDSLRDVLQFTGTSNSPNSHASTDESFTVNNLGNSGSIGHSINNNRSGTNNFSSDNSNENKKSSQARRENRSDFTNGIINMTTRDIHNLDYEMMSQELHGVCQDLESELNGLLSGEHRLSSNDADLACRSAVEGCVLIRAIHNSILRPDREVQSKAAKDSIVALLVRYDILDISNISSSMDSPSQTNSSSNSSNFNKANSSNAQFNTSIVVRFISSLANAQKQIPINYSIYPVTPQSFFKINGVSGPILSPYERLLLSSEMYGEYLCRLIIAISTSSAGVDYLRPKSSQLTGALADLILGFHVPVNSSNIQNSGIDEENSHNDSVMDRNLEVNGSKGIFSRSGTGILSACIMTLTILAAWSKSHQLIIVKHGCIMWLSKVVDYLCCSDSFHQGTINSSDSLPTPSSSSQLDECLALICITVQSLEAQRALVASTRGIKEMENFLKILFSLILRKGSGQDQLQKIDSSHAELSLLILKKLFGEIVSRQVARGLEEFSLFCEAIKNGKVGSIGTDIAKSLIDTVNSEEIDSNIQSDPIDFDEIVGAVWIAHSSMPDNIFLFQYIDNLRGNNNNIGKNDDQNFSIRNSLSYDVTYEEPSGRRFIESELTREEDNGQIDFM